MTLVKTVRVPTETGSRPGFGRQLTPEELPAYRKTVQNGLDALGIKTLAVILPATAFPTDSQHDTGIGSPLTRAGQQFTHWLGGMGFNAIQYLPNGLLKKNDPSPYMSAVFSGNPYLIDLDALTTPEWGEILSRKTFDDIVKDKPDSEAVRLPAAYGLNNTHWYETRLTGKHIILYNYVAKRSDAALKEAYQKFTDSYQSTPAVKKLKTGFETFCNNAYTAYWLENDSLYEALSTFYNRDEYHQWGNASTNSEFLISSNPQLDRHLFNRQKVPDSLRSERLAFLKADAAFKKAQDFYKFKQFILDRQAQNFQLSNKQQAQQLTGQMNEPALAETLTVKTMADGQINSSERDKWTHPEAFLAGWNLHSPPNIYWGFPVPDFRKISDANGQLLAAGRFIYERFHHLFRDNPGGVRVDHAVGLIDPWVAPQGKAADGAEAARLRSSPHNPALSAFSVSHNTNLITDDDINSYSQPIAQTIMRAASENKVSADRVMFEELDFHSPIPARVIAQNQWSKIQLTRWGVNGIKPQDWATLGNHDFSTIREWTDTLNDHSKPIRADVIRQLKTDLGLNPQDEQMLRDKPDKLVEKQFVRLFTSPAQHVQVMFLDMLGRKDCYNRENHPDPMNWRLRLTPDVIRLYYKTLAEGKGLNLPKVIAEALDVRSRRQQGGLNSQLQTDLNHFATVLAEPDVNTAG